VPGCEAVLAEDGHCERCAARAALEKDRRSETVGIKEKHMANTEKIKPACPDCGASVSAAGKRCRKCAGAARTGKKPTPAAADPVPRAEAEERQESRARAFPRGLALYLAQKLLEDPSTEIVAGERSDAGGVTLTLVGFLR
jgi:ribosomal protein L40E